MSSPSVRESNVHLITYDAASSDNSSASHPPFNGSSPLLTEISLCLTESRKAIKACHWKCPYAAEKS